MAVNMTKFNQSTAGKIFDKFNIIFFALLSIIMIFPIGFVLLGSFSSSGLVRFQFGVFTLDAYDMILRSNRTLSSILNSIVITLGGTFLCIVVTTCTAYCLSKNYLPGHKFFIGCVTFFMLFSIGLVPEYILFANVYHLKNTYWSMWLPGLVSSSNLVIMMNFFRSLPASIEESACIDGCNEAQSFWHIVLPMSKSSIATFTLFYAVGFWNSYLSAIIYLDESSMWPITVWLRQFIVLSQGSILEEVSGIVPAWMPSTAVKYATIVVSTLPIVCVYPFLQKYFAKGVLMGSIKG